MSVDKVRAAEDEAQAPEDDQPPRDTQEQLQPTVAPVERSMIVWRDLMLEQ